MATNRPLWIVPAASQPAGHILKALRDERDLTQSRAAIHFGLSVRAWQNYESDARRVPRWLTRYAVEWLNTGVEPITMERPT